MCNSQYSTIFKSLSDSQLNQGISSAHHIEQNIELLFDLKVYNKEDNHF